MDNFADIRWDLSVADISTVAQRVKQCLHNFSNRMRGFKGELFVKPTSQDPRKDDRPIPSLLIEKVTDVGVLVRWRWLVVATIGGGYMTC